MSEPLDTGVLGDLAKPTSPKTDNLIKSTSYRKFGDTDAIRNMIYGNVLNAAQTLGPLSNKLHTLEFSNVHYTGAENFTQAQEKTAILRGESLYRRLRGTATLKDNLTGLPIDQKEITIANVPHINKMGTFIMNGNDWILAHQMRLRPGIYTRIKENGELESKVNALPGPGGVSHNYLLDPKTGVFKIKIGQSFMPLISALRAVGATDKDLRSYWGNEITSRNLPHDSPHIMEKLYQRLIRRPEAGLPMEEKRKAIADVLTKINLDPEVTKRTLGIPFTTLSKEAILETTKKLLAVNRGEAEPDDRDHMAFQHTVGPEDIISERLYKDRSSLRDAMWAISRKRSLSGLKPGFMTRAVTDAIQKTGLGLQVEEINPSELLDHQTRATRLGEGGIKSIESVPDSTRSVQPSHLGFIDPIRTPESLKIGVDTRFANAAIKGNDGKIYAPFRDPKTGKTVYKSPQDVAELAVAFPNELNKNKAMVPALVNGKLRFIHRDKVDLEVPEMEGAFSPLANMVPMKSATKGQRVAMGSRMLTQALPLRNAQAPYVQSGTPEDPNLSFEQKYAPFMGAIKADQAGRVMEVTPDLMKVKYADGKTTTLELHNNRPYSRKTFLHNTPLVKPGDHFQPGQLLAKSNYTDDTGTTALGLNPYIAFIPYKGLNYEDSIAISEAFAKRATSEHMYQHTLDWEDNLKSGKRAYAGIFPGKYDKKTLDKLDERGLVKPGTVVNPGDPLILAVRQKEFSASQVHKKRGPTFADGTVTWEHDQPGEVTDVADTPSGVNVTVKAFNPSIVGDKFANRYGGKGVALVIPDNEMPHDENGKPFEILVNPLGVIGRGNPSQVIETALGKIVQKTGKPYKVQDFKNIDDLVEYAKSELQKHNLKDLETIIDPQIGRKIPNVLTGHQFFMKLHHTSESKDIGRGLGSYTAEGVPAKGGSESSKRMALMNTYAILSSGGTEVLRDAHLYRGQYNPEYWSAFQAGLRPPEPKVPLVYEKFVNYLKGSGINVVRDGTQMHIMAMTGNDVKQLAGDRFISNAETVNWKESEKAVAGGLFDPKLFGGRFGHDGTNWAAIKLHEPLPNPVMEEPINRLLNLTKVKFEDILSGKAELNGEKGPKAIYNALSAISVPKAIEQARAEIAGSKKTARDAAIRKLGYLKGLEKYGMKPTDWFMDRVPILPPRFRPIPVMISGQARSVGDANYLYKTVFDANENLKALEGKTDDLSHERITLYNSFKAVTGLGDPVQTTQKQKAVKGLLQHIFGSGPKYSMVQQKLLGANVDIVGRAAITPNPDLDMDSVGLPEDRAWTIYQPFIIRRLVRGGIGRLHAAQSVKDKSNIARQAMLDEMKERPVIIDRAPVLHRYSVMAFWPRITKGHTLQIPPLVTKGFGADFDGDAMQYHVPASDAAIEEAVAKMLPSRNLLSVAKFEPHYVPQHEFIGGLYNASVLKDPKKKPVVFRSRQDAINAYKRGEIGVDHPVEIVQP